MLSCPIILIFKKTLDNSWFFVIKQLVFFKQKSVYSKFISVFKFQSIQLFFKQNLMLFWEQLKTSLIYNKTAVFFSTKSATFGNLQLLDHFLVNLASFLTELAYVCEKQLKIFLIFIKTAVFPTNSATFGNF